MTEEELHIGKTFMCREVLPESCRLFRLMSRAGPKERSVTERAGTENGPCI